MSDEKEEVEEEYPVIRSEGFSFSKLFNFIVLSAVLFAAASWGLDLNKDKTSKLKAELAVKCYDVCINNSMVVPRWAKEKGTMTEDLFDELQNALNLKCQKDCNID
jgi:hypothetical protein